MAFITFLKKEEISKARPSIKQAELPPLPDIPSKTQAMHIANIGLPPLPQSEEKPVFVPLEPQDVPDFIPPLRGQPIPESPRPIAPQMPEMPVQEEKPMPQQALEELQPLPEEEPAEMDEAPEFPTLEKYLEKEGIEENIPELNLKEPSLVEKPIIRASPEQPIFLNLGNYRAVLATISQANAVVASSINTLLRMIDVKIPLDKEYSRLNELLEDVERKIAFVDQTFFEKSELR